MVVYSHEMGEGSTVCCVASRDSVKRSVEAKLKFMTLGSAVLSDRFVLAYDEYFAQQ